MEFSTLCTVGFCQVLHLKIFGVHVFQLNLVLIAIGQRLAISNI